MKFEQNAGYFPVDVKTNSEDVARHMLSELIILNEKKCRPCMGNGYDLLNEVINRKQESLFYLAYFDQLTGLPNRRLLMDRMHQAISVSNRTLRAISLLFIDLDELKSVNDIYGHAIGDCLLKEVSARMLSCLREGDTAARMGGDEFVVVLLESDLDRAILVANRILHSLRLRYEFDEITIISISASIGIAEYPVCAENIEALLAAADKAMYVAKKSGKDRYSIFTRPKILTDDSIKHAH